MSTLVGLLRADEVGSLTASSRNHLRVYPPHQEVMALGWRHKPDDAQAPTAAEEEDIISLLVRRERLIKLCINDSALLDVVARVIQTGGLPKLAELKLTGVADVTHLLLLRAALVGRQLDHHHARGPALTSLEIQGRLGGGHLSALLTQACDHLQVVKLQGLDPSAFAIWATYTNRVLPDLTQLSLTGLGETSPGLISLPLPLKAPNLQSLSLACIGHGRKTKDLLKAFEQGAWPHLRTLSLVSCNLEGSDVERLMQALVQEGRPSRRPPLETLVLEGNRLGNRGVAGVAHAMTRKALPALEVLDLGSCLVEARGLKEVAEALATKACPHLRVLELQGNPTITNNGVLALASALGRGGGACLKELGLTSVGALEAGGKAILMALGVGACPHLAKLRIGRNWESHHDFDRLVAWAMLALPELTDLWLTTLGHKGEEIIAWALQIGACPHLRNLVFDFVTRPDVVYSLAEGAKERIESRRPGLNVEEFH